MHNTSENNAELIKSMKVLEMITVAHEFCLFVEKVHEYGKPETLAYLSRILPLLNLKASLLPDLEEPDSEANERYLTEEEWIAIYKNASSHFQKQTIEIPGGLNDVQKVEIAEMIADIYQDMKDFVLLFQKDTMAAKENAVYWMKDYYKTTWGAKSLWVQVYVHEGLYGGSALK